jgi:hypothetical protein
MTGQLRVTVAVRVRVGGGWCEGSGGEDYGVQDRASDTFGRAAGA